MNITGLAAELLPEITSIPVVDCHEHLPPEAERVSKPIDALTLFSHYCKADLEAAGLLQGEPQNAVFDASKPIGPRWDTFKPYLEAIRYGSYAYSTLAATTDSPSALPEECDEGNGERIRWDVWIRYRASCDGIALASICDSDFDNRMAVYAGGCDGEVIACSDDACGENGTRAEAMFPVVAGEEYLIRIGCPPSHRGEGVLVLQCSGRPQ